MLIQVLIGRQRQEIDELLTRDYLVEDLCRLLKTACYKVSFTNGRLDLLQFLSHQLTEQHNSNLALIFQNAPGMANPLPDLRPRNLNRSSIFHQIIDGHAA